MFWGVTLESGKRYSQIVESSYHLSMAALEPYSREGKKPNKYVSVMIEHSKAEFLLCTLEYDRVMQVALDLLFVEGEEVSFFLNGEGTVHLTGYVTDNEDKSLALSDDSEETFEETISDTEDTSYSRLLNMDDERESTDEEWIPKRVSDLKEKKKLAKASTPLKVKTLEGKNVPKQILVTNFTDKTELEVKKEKQSPNKEKKKDKDEDISSFSESDEEMDDGGEESDDEESEGSKGEEEESDEEAELACPPSKKKKSVEDTTARSFLPTEQKKGSNKSPSHKEMSNLSGTTPSTPSSKSVDSKKKLETVGNKTKPETPFRSKSHDDNLQKTEEGLSSSKINDNTPKIAKEDAAVSLSKKKKKKKRSLSENKSSTEEKSFTNTPKQNTPSSKLQGGVKATDIREGNGPPAKKGRFVHICYVGRLSSGKEFDSARDRPFSFRLGHGEVIKGLDMGIEGMKVGGKRKLSIPPTQGYGNKKCGPIPPNSTLEFEVELKAVS